MSDILYGFFFGVGFFAAVSLLVLVATGLFWICSEARAHIRFLRLRRDLSASSYLPVRVLDDDC